MLIGNVGKDPEIRYTDMGVCTASLSLATTTPGYTLQNGTQVPERTEWHRIMLWQGPARICEQYVRKGDKLFIEGQLRTRSYTDKKGITRYITEVWADNIEMLSPRQQTVQPQQQTVQSSVQQVAQSNAQATPQHNDTSSRAAAEDNVVPF